MVFFGTGAAFACYPAVAWLIDTFGWRRAFFIEGLIILAIFAPVVGLILVYHPRQKGLTRDGLVQEKDHSVRGDRQGRALIQYTRQGSGVFLWVFNLGISKHILRLI